MARQIVVEIVGDAKKFNSTLDATAGSTTGFGSKMAGAFKVAAVAGLAVSAVAVGVGAAVFEAGSKMEAMAAKSATVFGDQLGVVQKWAKDAAGAMGLTASEATGLAANFADLLIPMGFTREQAAEMSTDVVGLSGALSEWSGGTKSAAEVSEILAKAMLGERDGLKALGISITEADVQGRLLKKGQEGLTGAALEQAKALATQELIMEKSTDAQAAYAAGTAKGLRAQNEMNAKLGEVKETLINALYPVLLTVGTFLADNLPAAITLVGDVIKELTPTFQVLGTIVGIVFSGIAEAVKVAVSILRVQFKVIGTIVGVAVNMFKGLASTVTAIFSVIGGVIKRVINAVIDIVNGIIGGINAIQVHIHVGPVNLDWNGLNIGKIPRMHAGGIVQGMPGSDQLRMLQAGERVLPRGQAGGLVVNIHIDQGAYIDGPGIDMLTNKIAARLRYATGR